MKFLITGDIHLRASNPDSRMDNFFYTQLGKMEQVFQIALKNECKYILCPGDVFDGPRPSFDVLEFYIKLMNQYNIKNDGIIKFLTIWGQHDQRFRVRERTALKLMEALGYMQTINKISITDEINLYGCDYGDKPPIIENENKFNILLIHGVVVNKPQWPGHVEFFQSEKFAKKYSFDLIISGDYHKPVFYKYGDQTILNCGCIVRKTIAEADIIPHIYILDINEQDLTYNLKKIELDHKPANEVFKKEALERESIEENSKMQEFIESIKNNSIAESLDFKKNLETMMKNAEKSVKDIIINSLEEIEK